MAITLKDVAEHAGVSRSAVSRTFTEGASVSKKMRYKVEKAASELQYSPNIIAQSLTTRRTKLIGLVADNFHNPIFLEVFDCFTRSLQDKGLRPLLVNLSDQTNCEQSIKMLKQYSVDGVVVASSTLPPDFSLAFQLAGVPVVNSFGRYSKQPKFHIVGIDNVECGKMAARILIEYGYTKIGFLGGPKEATSTQDRFAGFADAVDKAAQVEMTYSFAESYSFKSGRNEMLRLISTGNPAQVYFCGDDVLSIGALSAIADSNLSVPEDIGLIGLNDMEMAGWENINLTTIQQPIEKIITYSVELIVSMLESPEQNPETRLFPCQVVHRGTLQKH